MESNKNNTFKVISQIVIILTVGIISMWGASLFVNKTAPPVPTPVLSSAVTCPSDYISYEKTKANKNVVLLENKKSYGENGRFTGHDYDVALIRTGLNSQIACGYLFYRISVASEPIDQLHEGLYMTPTDSKQFGGHILPDEKSAISIKEVNQKTEVLIPLNNIPYDGTSRVNIKQADWVSLLNVTNRMSFNLALNTMNHLGHIDSVEIAYKCWNPQTGQETQDCNLELAQ